MRRVVITGIGIVSSIGNNLTEVRDSLFNGKSGIIEADDYKEMNFRSHVKGNVNIDLDSLIDRKTMRFMGDGSAYAYLSMKQAIEDSGLDKNEVSNEKTGLIAGSGGPSTSNMMTAFDTARYKTPKRVGPYMVPRCMSSTVSACLATNYKIKGVNYSITSACSTSTHCITTAVDTIQRGAQNIIFAGGGEEIHWTLSVLFDAMGALSSKFNDSPESASRPYDIERDGFIISGGGGIVVLEDFEHAKARGAKIYAEILGYGANSDGLDMVAPSGEGAERCMKLALNGFDGRKIDRKIDYINGHGTSTPVGDIAELNAINNVFSNNSELPYLTSTKSLTGHSQGATGVHEIIYTLLMMRDNFISGNKNLENPEDAIGKIKIPSSKLEDLSLDTCLSNSFGFGGTNGCIILGKI
tara:strand:+ start:51 stop:1283 length:1233 start_codon:yes stop_codon:yes gene_type:complete